MRIQLNARSAASSARKDHLSYKVAAIDIHTKVRMVGVAAIAEEVADATGAARELEGRKFGTGARERNHRVIGGLSHFGRSTFQPTQMG